MGPGIEKMFGKRVDDRLFSGVVALRNLFALQRMDAQQDVWQDSFG